MFHNLYGRIEEAYRTVQKHQKALLDEWKNSCNSTLKWIADSSARVQAQDKTAPDLDHARAQRQEIEVRKQICNNGLFNAIKTASTSTRTSHLHLGRVAP